MQDTDTSPTFALGFLGLFFSFFFLLHGVVQTAALHVIEDAWDTQTAAQTNKVFICHVLTLL